MKVREEDKDNLPPGFRFHPTDEELITHYLVPKVFEKSFSSIAVADVDINKCEPWHLPGKASMGEKEWYFFSTRGRKYPTGMRTNRATEAGYWKTTGKDREIFRANTLVGMKKTLVFYKGRAPTGEKSNWVMHEYRLENKRSLKITDKRDWVVCRVFKKTATAKKPAVNAPSSPTSFGSSNTNYLAINHFQHVHEDQHIKKMANLSNLGSNNASSLQNHVTRDSINNLFYEDKPSTSNVCCVNLPRLSKGIGFSPLSLLPSISGLLGSNSGTNSLPKAFQVDINQLKSETPSVNYSLPTEISHFGQGLGTNFQASSTMIMPQQHQQEQSVWGPFVSDDVV